MEIQYHLTEADILELMQYQFRQAPIHQNPVMVNRIIYVIAFIFLAIGSLVIAKDSPLPLTFMILAIILFFVYPVFFNWNLKRKVAKAYRNESMRATLASRLLRTADDGLVEKSSFGETKIKWESITKVDVTPAYAYISIQKIPSMIIPKDRVSMGDYESLLGECRKHVREITA